MNERTEVDMNERPGVSSNERTEVGRLVFEMGKLMKQYMRKHFDHEGLTMPQGSVLGILMKNGEMKITDLSGEMSLSNSTVSGIVDRLERQELVERRRSSEDRRVVYVKVSGKFLEIHEETHKKLEKVFVDMLGRGTHEEIEKIIDGLNTLKKIINECNNSE
jgi:DNA-binding MarR family transcriptional regulator